MSPRPPDGHAVGLWAAARMRVRPNAILSVEVCVTDDDDGDSVPAIRIDYIDLAGEPQRAVAALRFGGHPLVELFDDIERTAEAARRTREIRDTLPRRSRP